MIRELIYLGFLFMKPILFSNTKRQKSNAKYLHLASTVQTSLVAAEERFKSTKSMRLQMVEQLSIHAVREEEVC